MDKMRIALIGFIMMIVMGSVGYAGTYEKNIYVDMTILWGGTLPEAVYILPDVNDDSGIQLEKWEDGIWKPLANSGLYSEINRNNGIEPNYEAGLKLTDDNFDGIYTGKVKYIGNDGKRVKTRLYIRKNDTFNTLHTPYYERKRGNEFIDSTWRPIVGNGDAIKWSWEDKWASPDEAARPVEYKNSHTIYKGLSSDLGIVNVPYTNADTVLRRDVANSIVWSSSDANVADIEKIYDNIGPVQYVKSVRIIGKNIGTATITIKFGLDNSTTNGNLVYRGTKTIAVTVQNYNPITPFQTVILNAESDITSNDIIRIDNNSSFYTGTVPLAATFAPDTRDSALANPYNFATTTYTSFATPVGGEGYLWWVPSVVRTGAVLHLTRWNSTGTAPKDLEVAIWKNKDPAQEIKSTLKIPSPVGGMSANISSSAKKFYWNENSSNYSDYTKRDVIVRISKVNMSRTNMRYDLWEGKNPIVRADDATVVDMAKLSTFDKDTGLNYLDYVFSGANTLISVDGRMVKSDMYSNGGRTITISKFPVGKYRIQLYTLRSNLNSLAVSGIKNYSVLTFEGEDIFEVTSKDYDEDNTVVEDTYYINKINPYNFPKIQTYIMTRSKYLINPSTSSIFYDGTAGKVGERMEDSTGADGFSALGMAGSDITVTADTTYQSVKPQMDIVLCLDRSSSMSTRMAVVKETWKKFETNMAKRGYDVKYQMVSFGGAATSWWYEPYGGQVIHNGWVSSLIDNSGVVSPTSYETAYTNGNKFVTTANEGGYEPSNQALYKAADILNNYGRTIGEKKSKRYIIFFTDEGGRDDIDVDHQEKYIRGSGVTLIGLGQVYINEPLTKSQMFDDDSGEPVSGGSGRYYYDLRILLGDIFNWYQITNDSDNMLKKLERGMVNAGYTTFWRIEHKTPYPLEDYTKRSVEFEVRESTISGAVGATVMKYGGIAEERVYRAPKLFITGEIDTPQPNDAFQINPSDSTKYMINGKMWGELTFEDMSIPMAYADLSQIDLRIFEYKSLNNPSNYNNADSVIINGTDEKIMSRTGAQLSKNATDGSYEFTFNVEELKLRNTGFDSFFVKVTAKSTNSGMEGSIGQHNVKLDSDPPKLVDIKMVNTTVVATMNAMKASESTSNAFNMNITALNTLWYKPYSDTALASENTEILNPVLTNRKREAEPGVPYDGRFVKNGDNLTITAVFLDQNFDESSTTAIENYINAKFTGLETLVVTKTPVITTKNIPPLKSGETAIEITAVWSVKVANSSTADPIIKMNIEAVDKYGNKSSDSSNKNYVGDIEIAKVDNVNPGYPEWDSTKLIGDTGGNVLTPFAAKNDPAVAVTPVITKDAYRINCYDGATTDTNGIRAFKVYYTYDDTKSDVADAVADKILTKGTGNHEKDTASGDVHWFYIKAGNAVNLNGNTDILIPASGYGEKTPTNYGDDGKYIFKITAVDKAGNETMYSATKAAIESDGDSRTVYVDTVAPRIDRGMIWVPKYPTNDPYYNLLVKNGDKAYIYTRIKDFSAVSADISGVTTLKDRYYKSGSYPEYSEMIGNGAGAENPEFALISTSVASNITTVDLKIGDLTYSGGEASPSILISGIANKDYLANIKIGAKDLAGNEFIDTGITCEVDNVAPKPVKIKAIAKEGGLYGDPVIFGNTSDSILNIDKNIELTHFTRNSKYWLKVIKVDNDSDISPSIEANNDVVKVHIFSNGAEQSSEQYSNGKVFYEVINGEANKINSAYLQLEDKAGNKSSNIPTIISKIQDNIVIDQAVPNGKANSIFIGDIAKKESYDYNKKEATYKFKISINGIPDYAGLQNLEVVNKDKENSITYKQVTMYDDKLNNIPTIDVNGKLRNLAGEITLTFGVDKYDAEGKLVKKYDIPFFKIGSYVDLKIRVTDNLGNTNIVTFRSLVPNVNVDIKAQQKGSDKEIRTKVDVINSGGRIDLQKTEETGKNSK